MIKIELEENQSNPKGVIPQATHLLEAIDPAYIFETGTVQRHPAAIYKMSASKIGQALDRLIHVLDEIPQIHIQANSQFESNWRDDFLSGLKIFLYSMMEHFDDCRNILNCFTSPEEGSKKRKKRFKNFESCVASYRDHIGKVVNFLKHNQCHLRAFTIANSQEFNLGYYVEGVHPDGAIGPEPTIHKFGDTAFSIARDLPMHILFLYRISEALASSIMSITGISEYYYSDKDDKENELWKSRIEYISKLPKRYYKDEISRPSPIIEFQENGASTAVRMSYVPSSKKRAIVAVGTGRSQMITSGDGHSTKFVLPYHNRRKY